jgi:hypothetical protein
MPEAETSMDGAPSQAACTLLAYVALSRDSFAHGASSGLSLAMQLSAYPIVVKSDCLEAVQMINEDTMNRSPYAGLINEVKYFCGSARECNVVEN